MTKLKFQMMIIIPFMLNIFGFFFIIPYMGRDLTLKSQYIIFFIYGSIGLLVTQLILGVYYYKNFAAEKSTKSIVKYVLLNLFCIYPIMFGCLCVAALNLNAILDPRDEKIYISGTVINKFRSTGAKNQTYRLSVEKDDGSVDGFEVSHSEYVDYKIGDIFKVTYNAGKFGIPWRFEFHLF